MMSHCLIPAFAEHEKKIFFLYTKSAKEYFLLCLFHSPLTHCWSAHRAEEKMFLRTLLCQSAGWNHFHKRRHAVSRARNTRKANNFIIADTPRSETPHRTDKKSRRWCHIWTAPINRTIEYIQIAQSFVDSAVVWQSNRHSKFSLRCRFFSHEITSSAPPTYRAPILNALNWSLVSHQTLTAVKTTIFSFFFERIESAMAQLSPNETKM